MNTHTRSSQPTTIARGLRRSLVAVAVAAACGSALAQQAGDALDTVVVTAQKRQQSVIDVPIAMSVVSEETLEKTRGATLQNMQQLVPNFSIEDQSGQLAVTIRGVGGGGRNIGFDPRVGVYLDGIFMGQAQALRQPLFDVGQMEILRGPQGHLFGRNTVAGAVNITTREPGRNQEGYVRGVLGDHGTQELYASVSSPLSDTVAGKLSLASESRDGFTKNLATGHDVDDLKRTTARAQIVVRASDRLKLAFTADASSGEHPSINGEAVSGYRFQFPAFTPLEKRTVNWNKAPRLDADLAGLSMNANYQLDGGNTLTAIVGYRKTEQVKESDNDYSASDLLNTRYEDRFSQISEEVRIASPNAGKARYVVGVFHLTEKADTDRLALVGADAMKALVRIPGVGTVPFGAAFGVTPGARVTAQGNIKTDTWAVFGALDYDLIDALTLNLGGRYTRETKDVLFYLNGSRSGRFGIGTLNGYTDDRSENKFSPSVGLTFALDKSNNLYAKASRGFKSGGWNTEFISPSAAANPRFDTETVNTVEAGVKGKLLGGKVRYDVALYSSKFDDFQVFQFVNLGNATSLELRNAAAAKSRGLDGSVTVRATSALDLGLNLGMAKATFTDFANCAGTAAALVDCSGNRLPYAPELTAALTANYRLSVAGGRLDLYGEYSFHDKAFSDPVNSPTVQRIPAREQVNVRVAYAPTGSHWSFGVWATNLFDKDTTIGRGVDFLGNELVLRMQPRTAGVEARYELF